MTVLRSLAFSLAMLTGASRLVGIGAANIGAAICRLQGKPGGQALHSRGEG